MFPVVYFSTQTFIVLPLIFITKFIFKVFISSNTHYSLLPSLWESILCATIHVMSYHTLPLPSIPNAYQPPSPQSMSNIYHTITLHRLGYRVLALNQPSPSRYLLSCIRVRPYTSYYTILHYNQWLVYTTELVN